ncbi:MAG TPA: PP2C family serine/threonine-protein phosphatase [Acidimicrobiales bacterium]|nr:PP2C family serine/threonine-protein phosphatase [Acidimicrobiales bacterium]
MTLPEHPGAAGDRRRHEQVVDAGSATATGPRPDNQDRVAVSPAWAVVSDGAGGHRGGALAAQLALDAAVGRIDTAPATVDEGLLQRALDDAHRAVRARQAEDDEVASMAATLTLAVAASAGADGSTWFVANVGDSPAWSLASGRLTRLSEEHNLAAELVRTGAISRDEARTHPGRHIITLAIGGDAEVTTAPMAVDLRPGDALVLASDGVEVLDESTFVEVVPEAPSATQAARRLVDAALARGATDNVTVAVVRHRRTPAPGPAAGGTGAAGAGADP